MTSNRRGNIAKVEFFPVDIEATNWSENTVIVKVTDDNGIYGIGEADGPPKTMKAFSEMNSEHTWWNNIAELIIGRDPLDIKAIWDDMYESSRWIGMRGLGMFAISGIDMALYDLVGKQLNVPAYKLMGGAQREKITPYFTLYPSIPVDAPLEDIIESYKPLIKLAKEKGVKCVKVVIMPNKKVTDREVVYYLRKLRSELGNEIDMAVDCLYRWTDWQAARWTFNQLEDVDLYFVEAVLAHDDIIGHKKLSESIKTRLCGAEMATTRFETLQWIRDGGISIAQPDYIRSGGITELMRIAEFTNIYNVQLMPHNWKTGISNAAARNFGFANRNAKYVEYVHPDFYKGALISNLVTNEPEIIDGQFKISEKPGLGIELNIRYLKEKLDIIFD